MLTASEVEAARADEEMWVTTLPKIITPSNQIVWQCLHCLDLPAEISWQTLDDIKNHIQHQCV